MAKIYKIEVTILEPITEMAVDIEFEAQKQSFLKNKEQYVYKTITTN